MKGDPKRFFKHNHVLLQDKTLEKIRAILIKKEIRFFVCTYLSSLKAIYEKFNKSI